MTRMLNNSTEIEINRMIRVWYDYEYDPGDPDTGIMDSYSVNVTRTEWLDGTAVELTDAELEDIRGQIEASLND